MRQSDEHNDNNEMKMLIFRLGNTEFGINVAKVREIIERRQTNHIPHAHNSVEGIFKLRDEVLTLVKLGNHFNMTGEETERGEGAIIIIEFNLVRCGILVDAVEAIHTLQWSNIEPPSRYLTKCDAPITGTVQIDNRTILMPDFELVLGEILGVRLTELKNDVYSENCEEKDIRIVMVDDSSVFRKSMTNMLTRNGYCDVTICRDGQEAWETIQKMRDDPKGPCGLVISDVEMPKMDGIHLTKTIKAHPEYKHIPVVLFSSLINLDNLKEGLKAGADGQVGKPDSEELIHTIERCLNKAAVQSPVREEELVPA